MLQRDFLKLCAATEVGLHIPGASRAAKAAPAESRGTINQTYGMGAIQKPGNFHVALTSANLGALWHHEAPKGGRHARQQDRQQTRRR